MDRNEEEKKWKLCLGGCFYFFKLYKKVLFMMTWILVLLPIFFVEEMLGDYEKDPRDPTKVMHPYRCLFVIFLMCGFWVTNALPGAVTGLIPIVLYPLFGIQDSQSTITCYLRETNIMIFASFMFALAIEDSGLHIRLAFGLVMIIGCAPRRLHWGISMVTTLVSFWIINTAVTAMMVPLVTAILQEYENSEVISLHSVEPDEGQDGESIHGRRPTNFAIAFYLTIAYSATLGGLATVYGSDANVAIRGLFILYDPQTWYWMPPSQWVMVMGLTKKRKMKIKPTSKKGTKKYFPKADINAYISIIHWMTFGVPYALIMAIFNCIWLQTLFMGLFRPKSVDAMIVAQGNENKQAVKEKIKLMHAELGQWNFHEICVVILFFVLILLWFFRCPNYMTGWHYLFTTSETQESQLFILDSVPIVLIVIFTFLIPRNPACFKVCTLRREDRPKENSPGIITWHMMQQRLPWHIIFLVGGGFALSEGFVKSGLSYEIREYFHSFESINEHVVMVIICVTATIATNFLPNLPMCAVIIPMAFDIAISAQLHPFLLAFPAVLSCSLAFILPIGSPSNIFVAGKSNMKIIDMAKAGIVLSIVAILLLLLMWTVLGHELYDLEEYPKWANR